jgi:transposase
MFIAQASNPHASGKLANHVLAIALANKLARIAWSVLARGRAFDVKTFNNSAAQPV